MNPTSRTTWDVTDPALSRFENPSLVRLAAARVLEFLAGSLNGCQIRLALTGRPMALNPEFVRTWNRILAGHLSPFSTPNLPMAGASS